MNAIVLRSVALLLHVLVNVIVVNYMVNVDVTGSWWRFGLFVVASIVLLYLTIRHVISFIYFIKSKST
jgi:hypothetical protein